MKIFTALVLRTRAVKIFITALVPRSVKFITRPPPVAVIPHYNPSAEVSKSHDMPDSEAGKVIISNITEILVLKKMCHYGLGQKCCHENYRSG